MSQYNTLKTAVANVVRTNGNNEITGSLLQQVLIAMIDSLGGKYLYAGVATPGTDPGTPDQRVFYIAATPGVYASFGNVTLTAKDVAIFYYENSWGYNLLNIYNKAYVDIIASRSNLINAGAFGTTNTFPTLADALANVPSANRVARAVLYYLETGGLRGHFYFFLSNNTADSSWLNESNWKQIYTAYEANQLFEKLENKVTAIDGNSTDDQYPSAKAVYDLTKIAVQVGASVFPFLSEFAKLKSVTTFNGTSSIASCNAVKLQNEGDELEIELFPDSMSGNQQYALGQYNAHTATRLGATQTVINVRANDNTWIALNVSLGGTKTHYVLKIKFESGNTKIYIDNVLLHTYTGQKAISINLWGRYQTNYYWKGRIGYIKVNGTLYNTIDQLPGWSGTDTTTGTSNVFLTDEQAALLNNIVHYPDKVVSYNPTGGANSAGMFTIYQRYKNTDIYFMLNLSHLIDNTDSVYLNLWRINTQGGVYRYTGNAFVSLGPKLLVGAENEFTFGYSGASDFTGGFHGDERIDSTGCFANFYLDGILLTPTELASSFTKECNTFYMLQKSTLHETTPSGGSPVAGHPVFAYHFKKTSFEGHGFKCVNRVDFDFTNSNLTSVTTTSLFTGLVCVAKDGAEYAYADDFVIYSETGSDVQTPIRDAVTGKVEFYKTALSCSVDSNTLTEENKNLRIVIWDRTDDTKYYRYAANRTFETGDVYMSETVVSWNYKDVQ